MDTSTPVDTLLPPVAEPQRRQSHKERRERREEIAKFVANLFETKPEAKTNDIIAEASRHFGLCTATTRNACSEFGIKRQCKPKRKVKNDKTERIKNLLRTTERTCSGIGTEIRVSKQRVHQVYIQMLEDGEQIPSRERGLCSTKKSLDRENKLIERYKETKSVYEARTFAGMTRQRACQLLREAGLLEDKYVKPDGSPRITQTMLVLGALFDDSLSISDIARKFQVPAPRIFNIAQSALACGVPLPIRTSGTVSAFGAYLSALILREMATSNKPIILSEFSERLNEPLHSLPPNARTNFWRLNTIIKMHVFRFIRDGLATSAYCRHLRAKSFALTEKGRHDAELLSDEIMSDLRSKVIEG